MESRRPALARPTSRGSHRRRSGRGTSGRRRSARSPSAAVATDERRRDRRCVVRCERHHEADPGGRLAAHTVETQVVGALADRDESELDKPLRLEIVGRSTEELRVDASADFGTSSVVSNRARHAEADARTVPRQNLGGHPRPRNVRGPRRPWPFQAGSVDEVKARQPRHQRSRQGVARTGSRVVGKPPARLVLREPRVVAVESTDAGRRGIARDRQGSNHCLEHEPALRRPIRRLLEPADPGVGR